ncbi:MAG: capsular polysaccharide synthesis protein [Butyrivibrio sp.]|nr:capsular polysaccharide synthesis protein [Oribacterium sp.]MBP3816846.1 capsular polysaccharide synthesis protein [Butyrivibrio sp.]
MGLKETFRKQGGMKLIKQYIQVGVLGTAIGEFLLLGKSRTALEILRLSTQLKTKQKLYKKYCHVLNEFEDEYNPDLPHENSDKVWVCWFQGMENAPELVKSCYKSIKQNLTDREIILITSENMDQYVQFPRYIIDKWESGVITNTHLTDLLRLELLINYGGLWLDATVFCSEQESNIPDYFFNSDLFFYQSLKPGRDGKSTYISSWLMGAKTNNKVLMATRELCYEYWKRENQMLDYFLLHDLFSIVLDRYTDEWKKVVPRDNATPHVLLLRLFDQYDEKIWEAIKRQTPFHKLSYKYKDEQRLKDDTFFKRIIGI